MRLTHSSLHGETGFPHAIPSQMNTPDWTLLRSFLAVVEMRSLSAAATRIGATQPTLSRHIRALETALGLFGTRGYFARRGRPRDRKSVV